MLVLTNLLFILPAWIVSMLLLLVARRLIREREERLALATVPVRERG